MKHETPKLFNTKLNAGIWECGVVERGVVGSVCGWCGWECGMVGSVVEKHRVSSRGGAANSGVCLYDYESSMSDVTYREVGGELDHITPSPATRHPSPWRIGVFLERSAG